MKEQPTTEGGNAAEPPAALDAAISRSFGFEDDLDAWMARVASAVREPTTEELGSIAGYRLVAVVARGGQGTVYRAIEPGTERAVAVKRLHATEFASSARARFDREAEVVAGLRHPGIVTLLSSLDVDGQRILVMEWIDGRPVDRWADESRSGESKDATREIVVTIAALADAVAHAHRNGVIHRDLKPSNVLVDRDGAPHVLDFGLALPSGPDVTAITLGSGFLGTPSYAAPEQVAGGHVDSRSDVHAVGALLYRALTGSHPFDDRAPLPELFRQIAESDPMPPSRRMPSIGRELSLVCMKALAKEPERRYQSMEALASDLRRWLSDEPVLAHPAELRYVLRKAIARHRVAFVVATVALVLLVAASVISTSLALSLSAEREKLDNARIEEQLAKVAAQAGADEATRRAREAEQSRESAERARDFLQGIFTAMRESGAEDARNTALAALDLARRMLSIEDRPPNIEGELRETLAAAFDELGEVGAALNEYRRADELLTAAPDPDLKVLARARLGQTKQLLSLDRHGEAMAPVESALAWYRSSENDAGITDSLRLLAMAKKATLGATFALPLAEEALDAAMRSGDSLRVGSALSTLALVQEELGFPERAFETSRESVECMRERVDARHPELARALHNHAYLGMLVRRWTESVEAAREAIAIREANYGYHSSSVQGTVSVLVRALRGSGQLAEAIELGRAALDGSGADSFRSLRTLGLAYQWLRLLEERGDPEDLREIDQRTRTLIDTRLGQGDVSSVRLVDVLRLRTRCLARGRGAESVRELLCDEPDHWRTASGDSEQAPIFATYAALLGCAEVRCLPPAELLDHCERLALRMGPLLSDERSERIALLRLLADAREAGGDLAHAASALREAIELATKRQGDNSPIASNLRRSLTRVEATMASRPAR